MISIIDNVIVQVIVTLSQQLIVFRQVRQAGATSSTSTQKRASTLAVSGVNESAHGPLDSLAQYLISRGP